jgi:Tol biopolymer transport system component
MDLGRMYGRTFNFRDRAFGAGSRLSILCGLLVSSAAVAGEVRYTPDDGHAQNPVWSQDGKWVAFEVNRNEGGGVDLYVSSVAGAIAKDGVKVTLPGGTSTFGGGGQVVSNPTWHPQGFTVFEGSNQGGQFRLYIYNPGGASATELLPTTTVPGDISFPSISKDGNMVVFVSDMTGSGDVRTWNRTNNQITQITATEGSESFPSFSADGKKLLYARDNNGTVDIYEMDIASKTERSIASGGGDQTRPEYLPNGGVIYFDNNRGTTVWDIVTVDSAGANKKVVAKDVALPLRARPALSPDGQWVAWGTSVATSNTKLYLAKLDGSKSVEIPTDYTAVQEPAITVQNGRTLAAFVYLPQSGADWHGLMVTDITDKLAE